MDRFHFDKKIENFISKAEKTIPNELLPNLPLITSDVHDWYDFEHQLWEVGEEIRIFLKENNRKLNKYQIEKIADICLDKRAKRGRQSFVMLLGKKIYADYANKIISLLTDDDVDGHVINTLYKMQVNGYANCIEPFLNNNKKWIRNEAKRYIEKYGK